MKIISKIKDNFLSFILGVMVFGGISYGVASQILATQVSYSNEDSPSNVTNVSAAITELYGLAEECQTSSSSGSGVTYYGKDVETIYLDPTGTVTNCSESNYSSTASTGCFRFYVYAEDSEYKYAILDHNTTAQVSSGFYAAQSQVKQDTKEWNPNYQARNIRADEVYKITETTNNQEDLKIKGSRLYFYFNQKNEENGQGYGWLFDRTYGCTDYGCTTADSTTEGYWTSDMQNSSNAWNIQCNGVMGYAILAFHTYGVRPVIQIAK